MRHQSTDEVDVAAQSIELGDDNRAGLAVSLRLGQRGYELRPAFERVKAFAGLFLLELGGDLAALGLGEAGDRGALRLDPQA